jgi:hypothetical protein
MPKKVAHRVADLNIAPTHALFRPKLPMHLSYFLLRSAGEHKRFLDLKK